LFFFLRNWREKKHLLKEKYSKKKPEAF